MKKIVISSQEIVISLEKIVISSQETVIATEKIAILTEEMVIATGEIAIATGEMAIATEAKYLCKKPDVYFYLVIIFLQKPVLYFSLPLACNKRI